MTNASTHVLRNAASLLVLATAALAPTLAHAGNGTHPRTPVLWSDAPCLTVIDRSVSPIHEFGYAIPYEDTAVTADEVPQSRSHQFFAFCRDHHLEEVLPSWITASEPMAAAAAGLGNLEGVDFELDVLENSPEWADCWTRITADAERRPITFAAAAMPVTWDTTALPAGTWVVEGYTYEPWFNLWSPHPGVFKIVDDPDPAASAPAAALTFAEQELDYGEGDSELGSVSGCVDAMPGTTMTLSWALSGIGSEPTWTAFASDVPVEGSSFELPFEPPAEAVSSSVMIRAELVDPLGRSWTTQGNAYLVVVEVVGGDEACEEGGFVTNPCDTSEGGTSETQGEGESAGDELGSSGPAASDDASACSCSASPSAPTWALGLVVVVLALGRRRD
jgi:MYXO-CTERM domain-containing protein